MLALVRTEFVKAPLCFRLRTDSYESERGGWCREPDTH